MEKCIFCKIIAGKSPSSVIFEDDVVLVLMTIGPINPGHVMVIPKKHSSCLAEMEEETGAHLFKVTMRTAQAIRESSVKCEGINLFLADGKAAFQDVFHVHMHVIPRFVGDPFKIMANWEDKPSRDELDEIAGKIEKAYEKLWGVSGKGIG